MTGVAFCLGTLLQAGGREDATRTLQSKQIGGVLLVFVILFERGLKQGRVVGGIARRESGEAAEARCARLIRVPGAPAEERAAAEPSSPRGPVGAGACRPVVLSGEIR
jgi:hypothetical protein